MWTTWKLNRLDYKYSDMSMVYVVEVRKKFTKLVEIHEYIGKTKSANFNMRKMVIETE